MNSKKLPTTVRGTFLIVVGLLVVALSGVSGRAQQQKFGGYDKDRGREILKILKQDLEDNYYDPKFHGMNLEERFKIAKDKINDATSNGQIFSIIAQMLTELNDSHTFFIPPGRVVDTDYGWEMRMVGKTCYVVDVTPGSDAESKGVKVGDEVWSIDGFEPTRENLWKIKYSYYTLKPRPGMRVVLHTPRGEEHEIEIAAHIVKGRERALLAGQAKLLDTSRFHEVGSDVIVWKLPSFEVEQKEIDDAMTRVHPFKALVLDLRGNSGGYEDALLRLLGYFFDHDVKVGETKRRKGTKPMVAKARQGSFYPGRLTVLIDSDSASASELFARVIQLEKRGTIIGDVSAGAVMRAQVFGEADVIGGFDEEGMAVKVTPFAVSITDADIIMSDGASLERVGVAPDELLLPAATDLAKSYDPVLSHALTTVNATLAPAEAGALFPVIHLKPEEKPNKKKDAKKS
jgi:C-terminal processing protease CtpA/Prc